MGWRKLTAIVVGATVMLGGAMALSMQLTKQQSVELEVNKNQVKTPKAGDTTTLADMENMPIYYDDDALLLLPVRNVVESLGGSVIWDTKEKATKVSFYGKELILHRNSQDAKLNGYEITLEREAEAINGCLYVSADIFSEYFATAVLWDSEHQIVTIQTGDNTRPILAHRLLEGEKGERTYSVEIPVVVGLNDISYEKNLNQAWQEEVNRQIASFLPAKDEAKATAEKDQQNNVAEPEETNLPKTVKIRFADGYCSSDFLSFYWVSEKDGRQWAKGVNLDLQMQKEVTLNDLLAVKDVAAELEMYAEKVHPKNYMISPQKELVLLENNENGIHNTVFVPKEVVQAVWKEKYNFLLE